MDKNKSRFKRSEKPNRVKTGFGKKLLAGVLAALLAAGAAPMRLGVQAETPGAGAAREVQTGSVDGIVSGSVTWSYDPATKTTTVTGTGERNITYSEDTIPDLPTSADQISPFPMMTGSIRFVDCKISGSCDGLFGNLPNLKTIDFQGFDTSNVTDMGFMFYFSGRLTSLDMGSLNTSNVINMEHMFDGCSGLTSMNISGLKTSCVTDMRYMFSNCRKLTSLDVSGLDISNVTDTSFMFFACDGLASIDVSALNTSSVTDMSFMFSCCNGLTGIDVSALDTSSVTDMWGMFSWCDGLTSIDMSGLDMSSVTYMGQMFEGCSSLTELRTPAQMGSVSTDLPGNFVDPDGNVTSKLTTAYAGKKLTKVTSKELPAAVIYAPYEYVFDLDFESLRKEGYNKFTFERAAFPDGVSLKGDSQLYLSGVPTETGEFTFHVTASQQDGQDLPDKILVYRLTVEQNTDANVETFTDKGYELVETVPDLSVEDLPPQKEQTMCSVGAYEEFVALYLDGGKLIRGEGDTLTGDAEYLAHSGSTRITILNQTLAKNGSGTHTLAMEFRKSDTGELRRAVQNYTIAESQEPDSGNGGGNDGDNHSEEDDESEDEEPEDDKEIDAGSTLPNPGQNVVQVLSEEACKITYFDYTVDWDEVGRMLDAAVPKQNVDVLAGRGMEIPAWILAKCVARDVTLALHAGNGVALSVTGGEIRQTDQPFEVSMGDPADIPVAVKESILRGALAGRAFEIADAAGAEAFPYPTNIHFLWGKEYAGKQAILYRYEKETGGMAPTGIFTVNADGRGMFGISGSGEYIAVVFGDESGSGIPGIHTVASGDTLSGIAAKYMLTVQRLMEANPWIKEADKLYPWQKLIVG